MRLGKFHYAHVLADDERSYCRALKRVHISTELIECMSETWKLVGGTLDDGKSADELALGNLG